MFRLSAALVCVLAAAAGARAATLEIALPDADAVETTSVAYECPQGEITATYYDAGDNHLAAVIIDGRTVVMANVISASGAKYAGGPYIWWTKGDEASFEDLMKGEDAAPIICTAK